MRKFASVVFKVDQQLVIIVGLMLSPNMLYCQLFDSIPKNQSASEYFIRQPKEHLIASQGYYYASAEMMPVRDNAFRTLLTHDNIPVVELNGAYQLAYLSFIRNWMYTAASYSYASNQKVETDSLVSSLNQFSIAGKFGYNVMTKTFMVASSYVGLRYTRFKHVTSPVENRIDLNNYLSVREIDLRISQFTGEIGFNASFYFMENYSIGVYAAYLFDFHSSSIIHSKQNRINYNMRNPIENYVIGLGFGMGFLGKTTELSRNYRKLSRKQKKQVNMSKR